MNLLLVYLLLINAIGLALMLADKQAAKNKRRRIPKKHLLLTAFFGGSIGVYLGMRLAHHKTRHKKFSIGVPILLAAQIVAFCVMTHFVPLNTFQIDLTPGRTTSSQTGNTEKKEKKDPIYNPDFNPKDYYEFE